MLLYFLNPIVTSLRGLQQASELQNFQAKLGCARASLGSRSESTAVFNAERLQHIVFKHMPGCRRLLSHKQSGIEIQIYSDITPAC